MSERIVADSTCLIALERISHLDILPALFEPVLIPPAVEQEFGISLPWLKLERLFDQTLVVALKMMLDDGEAEAIALAQEQKCRIILDDRQARSVSSHMGLRVIGTVGTLILAKQRGILPTIKPVLQNLDDTGFYISTALEEALRLAEERRAFAAAVSPFRVCPRDACSACSQALLDRRYNLVCIPYARQTLHDQPLRIDQVIRGQGVHLIGLGHVRAKAVRPHMDAFDSVFGDGPSPSVLVLVQRQVEDDDRQGSRLFLDCAEIGQVNDARSAPTCPEVEQNYFALELAQRYGLTVEVVEGESRRGVPGL